MFIHSYSCDSVLVPAIDFLKLSPPLPIHTQPCSETYHELSEEDDIFTSKLVSVVPSTASAYPNLYEETGNKGTSAWAY